MKTLYSFKQFVNEGELNEFTRDSFDPPKEQDPKKALGELYVAGFKKTVKTNKEAAKRIAEFTGATMFVHVQYHDIEDRGGELRLHQSQYYINKTQEGWQGRKSPKVTLVGVQPHGAAPGKDYSSAYVDTDIFLSELKKATITNSAS